MDDIREIRILGVNLKVMRIFGVSPSAGDSTKKYYLRLLICCAFYSIICLCSGLHLIVNLYYGKKLEKEEIAEDFSIILTGIEIYLIILIFSQRKEYILKVTKDVGDYSKFGKPRNAESVEKFVNLLSIVHLSYCVLGVFFFISWKMYKIPKCEAYKLANGSDNVCGLISNVGIPFELTTFWTILLGIAQVVAVFALVTIAFISTNILFGTIEHFICKMDHMILILEGSLEEVDEINRKKKINHFILYHIYLVRLSKELDQCYTPLMCVHITISALTTAASAFTFLMTKDLVYLMYLLGCIVIIFMICYSGQRLKDKSEEVSRAVYNLEWYTSSASLQRDILFILLKSQTTLCLTAGGFGIFSYEAFKVICQSIYSYLTLINTQLQN